MILGDILARLTNESTAAEAILGVGNLALLAAVQEQADADEVELAAYVTQMVQRYANDASDEEWATLIGMLNRSQDPGAICLKRAFEYNLRCN